MTHGELTRRSSTSAPGAPLAVRPTSSARATWRIDVSEAVPLAGHFECGESRQTPLDLGRKDVAVHRQRGTGGDSGDFRCRHDQRIAAPHLVVEQADRVFRIVVGTEAVRTDQFGKARSVMGGRGISTFRQIGPAHLRQPHANSAPGKLPGRLAPREPAADNVDLVCHCVAIGIALAGRHRQSGQRE